MQKRPEGLRRGVAALVAATRLTTTDVNRDVPSRRAFPTAETPLPDGRPGQAPVQATDEFEIQKGPQHRPEQRFAADGCHD